MRRGRGGEEEEGEEQREDGGRGGEKGGKGEWRRRRRPRRMKGWRNDRGIQGYRVDRRTTFTSTENTKAENGDFPFTGFSLRPYPAGSVSAAGPGRSAASAPARWRGSCWRAPPAAAAGPPPPRSTDGPAPWTSPPSGCCRDDRSERETNRTIRLKMEITAGTFSSF